MNYLGNNFKFAGISVHMILDPLQPLERLVFNMCFIFLFLTGITGVFVSVTHICVCVHIHLAHGDFTVGLFTDS